MNLISPGLRYAVVVCGVSVVSACGVVGKGLVPNKLSIGTASVASLPAVRAYQCVGGGLRGYVSFTDGSLADYTGRTPMVWTSSDPSVVAVNANTGALTPQQPGTATITASYYTLSATTQVKVSALTSSDLQLYKMDQESYVPVGSEGFTIATDTSNVSSPQYSRPPTQNIELIANESGGNGGAPVQRNVTASTTFSIVDSGGTTVTDSKGTTTSATTLGAALSSNGGTYQLLGGNTVGNSPYTLTATLSSCDSPIQVSVPLNVANVASLQLSPETDPAGGPQLGFATTSTDTNGNTVVTPLPLAKGYGVERMKLLAVFPQLPGQTAAQTQDLSLVGIFATSDPTVAAFDYATLSASNANDILTALNTSASTSNGATPSTSVTATFEDGTGNTITSNALTVPVKDHGTLSSISVMPATASITASSDTDSAQFHAIGTFADGTTQDVSRLTTFTVDNSNLASIDTAPSVYSGLSFPVATQQSTAGGTVNVNATTDTGGSNAMTVTAPMNNAGGLGAATLTVNPQPDSP